MTLDVLIRVHDSDVLVRVHDLFQCMLLLDRSRPKANPPGGGRTV